MADRQIHHVQMHYGAQNWIWGAVVLLFFIPLLGWQFWRIEEQFKPSAAPEPFVVDLRTEQFPASIDYLSRREILVRVEKPEGAEVRLLDASDGSLIGTFFEQTKSPLDSQE